MAESTIFNGKNPYVDRLLGMERKLEEFLFSSPFWDLFIFMIHGITYAKLKRKSSKKERFHKSLYFFTQLQPHFPLFHEEGKHASIFS